MMTFLSILLIAAMIAVVVVLIRGLATFLLNASADARSGETGPSESALKSNKMMQYRVFFQAIAVFIIVLILFIGSARS
ncbi:twin transmembrane helix small protein [Sphingomonas populi]|uniref:Twin transmembrane helix small protein n=2 Tax=Sphingomonas populi TaxID=2484750 RepID=A0A4Q6XZ18_9SPHN|nr:twin transmembrane helix small protein [Sphingomonas populi]RZF65505.1 twin transmembrane helix small protein [Sphingomonas populi]